MTSKSLDWEWWHSSMMLWMDPDHRKYLNFALCCNFKYLCVWVVARLPQRLESKFVEIISSLRGSLANPPLEKLQKTLILSFEANSALSCQYELFSAF